MLLSSCSDRFLGNDEPDTPGDSFVGVTRDFTLGPETSGFVSGKFTLVLQAPDGSIISRSGIHRRVGSLSRMILDTGLCEGVFRLMYLEYPIADNPEISDLAGEFGTARKKLSWRTVSSTV